jgi:hypothetical protein
MTEWTISIETPEETTDSVDVLERFAEALEEDPRARGPAASLNTERGVISATFTVDESDRDEAALAACLAYWGALHDAGIEGMDLSRLEVAPIGANGEADAAERFTARIAIERDTTVA